MRFSGQVLKFATLAKCTFLDSAPRVRQSQDRRRRVFFPAEEAAQPRPQAWHCTTLLWKRADLDGRDSSLGQDPSLERLARSFSSNLRFLYNHGGVSKRLGKKDWAHDLLSNSQVGDWRNITASTTRLSRAVPLQLSGFLCLLLPSCVSLPRHSKLSAFCVSLNLFRSLFHGLTLSALCPQSLASLQITQDLISTAALPMGSPQIRGGGVLKVSSEVSAHSQRFPRTQQSGVGEVWKGRAGEPSAAA